MSNNPNLKALVDQAESILERTRTLLSGEDSKQLAGRITNVVSNVPRTWNDREETVSRFVTDLVNQSLGLDGTLRLTLKNSDPSADLTDFSNWMVSQPGSKNPGAGVSLDRVVRTALPENPNTGIDNSCPSYVNTTHTSHEASTYQPPETSSSSSGQVTHSTADAEDNRFDLWKWVRDLFAYDKPKSVPAAPPSSKPTTGNPASPSQANPEINDTDRQIEEWVDLGFIYDGSEADLQRKKEGLPPIAYQEFLEAKDMANKTPRNKKGLVYQSPEKEIERYNGVTKSSTQLFFDSQESAIEYLDKTLGGKPIDGPIGWLVNVGIDALFGTVSKVLPFGIGGAQVLIDYCNDQKLENYKKQIKTIDSEAICIEIWSINSPRGGSGEAYFIREWK